MISTTEPKLPRWARLVIVAQFAVPGCALVLRWVTGQVAYGLGWEMFSG